MTRDAQNEAQAEGESAVNSACTGSEAAPLGSVDDISAESGVEFKDQDSVTFNLKNLNDCRFLFGKYGDEVYANEHNRTAETSFVIASADPKTGTIYICPAK